MRDFTGITHPLNQLLRKDVRDKFTLHDDQLNSFGTLIDKIFWHPLFALPNRNLPYSAHTEASAYGIRCTIFRTQDDEKRKRIGYWSRTLNTAKKNYVAPER